MGHFARTVLPFGLRESADEQARYLKPATRNRPRRGRLQNPASQRPATKSGLAAAGYEIRPRSGRLRNPASQRPATRKKMLPFGLQVSADEQAVLNFDHLVGWLNETSVMSDNDQGTAAEALLLA